MSLVGGLSQSPETTQAVRSSATSRLRGSPTAHKSALGETWRGWPRERPDEREGPRLALWGPDAISQPALQETFAVVCGRASRRKIRRRRGETGFDRRGRLMAS
jgi:hypothetical protein